MNEAVITGYNVVSPLGVTREEFTERMFAGDSGVTSLAEMVRDPEFPISCAGLLPPGIFPPMELNLFGGEIEAQLTCLLQPYLSGPEGIGTIDGVVFGTNHGLAKFADIGKFHQGQTPEPINLRQDLGLNLVLRHLEEQGHARLAPANVVSLANGCVTGLAAVMYAAQRVRSGRNHRMLVLCDEIRVRPEDLLKYNALGALSREKGPPKTVSRPFSKGRSGFVKGEGAGLMFVESRSNAEQRGAEILASITGYSLTSDAWRLTDGREDLKGMCAAIEKALSMSRLKPAEIDYINAHGTSTPKNDRLETMGIKKIFGDAAYNIPVSSLKSQIGHLNFACGIVELIACVIMLQCQRVAPTINFERDPECDLNYVPERAAPHRINHILKNSFGFGGANAAMILRR